MKTILVTSLCSLVLALSAFGQSPTTSPAVASTPVIASTPAAVVSPAATISATPDEESALERKIKSKVGRHFRVDLDDDHGTKHSSDHESDSDFLAIPIVAIIFSTIFGTPVLVVGLIMFFSYWRSRSLHRTVRTMVEKGQPVPPELFGGVSVVRARSDMRRGVVLVMIGVGLMIFFGANNDWEGGAWSLGVIPFLIGCGYLLVWKLEGNKPGTDNVTRLP